MKSDLILAAMNDLPEDLLRSAAQARQRGRHRAQLRRGLALAACAAIIVLAPLGYRAWQTQQALAQQPADTLQDSQTNNQLTDRDKADPDTEQTLLALQLGPLQLGMTQKAVREALGEPDDTSNAGITELSDGTRLLNWFYNISGDPTLRYDVSLCFADAGDGWRLNEISADAAAGWTLSAGIGPDSTPAQAEAALPGAQRSENTTIVSDTDGLNETAIQSVSYRLQSGHLALDVVFSGEQLQSIRLGTYYAAPEDEWEQTGDAAAYSFDTEAITVYRKTSTGWEAADADAKQTRHLVTLLGIEELQPMEAVPETEYYLDLHNGTVAAISGPYESGALYALQDRDAFEAAFSENGDPRTALELIQPCRFPEGCWSAAAALFHLTVE